MSKSEPKGQRVKTFKHWMPQPDLTTEETQIVVYFKADEGKFYIYQGAHIFEACMDEQSKMYDARRTLMRKNSVSAHTLNDLIEAFEGVSKQYERLLREAKKIRVIRFRFKRNVRAGEFAAKSDISFCGSPTLHFSYEILWRVNDALYRQHDPECPLEYAGKAKDRFDEGHCDVIEWTAEREAFFESMSNGLIELIGRVEAFASNLQQNVDIAIAGGGQLLLAAPEGNNA